MKTVSRQAWWWLAPMALLAGCLPFQDADGDFPQIDSASDAHDVADSTVPDAGGGDTIVVPDGIDPVDTADTSEVEPDGIDAMDGDATVSSCPVWPACSTGVTPCVELDADGAVLPSHVYVAALEPCSAGDESDGSPWAPYPTLGDALAALAEGGLGTPTNVTVHVALASPGYEESGLVIDRNVEVLGGYTCPSWDACTWTRDSAQSRHHVTGGLTVTTGSRASRLEQLELALLDDGVRDQTDDEHYISVGGKLELANTKVNATKAVPGECEGPGRCRVSVIDVLAGGDLTLTGAEVVGADWTCSAGHACTLATIDQRGGALTVAGSAVQGGSMTCPEEAHELACRSIALATSGEGTGTDARSRLELMNTVIDAGPLACLDGACQSATVRVADHVDVLVSGSTVSAGRFDVLGQDACTRDDEVDHRCGTVGFDIEPLSAAGRVAVEDSVLRGGDALHGDLANEDQIAHSAGVRVASGGVELVGNAIDAGIAQRGSSFGVAIIDDDDVLARPVVLDANDINLALPGTCEAILPLLSSRGFCGGVSVVDQRAELTNNRIAGLEAPLSTAVLVTETRGNTAEGAVLVNNLLIARVGASDQAPTETKSAAWTCLGLDESTLATSQMPRMAGPVINNLLISNTGAKHEYGAYEIEGSCQPMAFHHNALWQPDGTTRYRRSTSEAWDELEGNVALGGRPGGSNLLLDSSPLDGDGPAIDFPGAGCQLIDKGNLDAVELLPRANVDLEGHERPTGPRPDIGADEWGDAMAPGCATSPPP